MSLDLTNSFKTSVYARVKGFVSNMDYLENRRQNFIQKKNSRKRRLSRTHVSFSGFCAVFFMHRHFTPLMTSKGKKKE